MTLSVNTNSAALAALAALNRTADDLSATNTRVSSGLKVGESKDNPSIYAVAQAQRADIKALGAVTDGLNRAQSIADVATSAGQTVSDLLNTLKSKVLAATDNGLDANSRAALNSDFKSLLSQISQTVGQSSFDGVNLLDGSQPNGVPFIANADASATITLSSQNLSLGGSVVTVPANADISTLTNASAVLSLVTSSISNVNSALANLGSQASQISAHNSFVGKLADSLTSGVGQMVDTDIAKESARLTALQVQQQLGAQSLSIANQSSSVILNLLKG